MKTLRYTAAVFAALVALPAHAATLSLSPSTLSVSAGQTVSVQIMVAAEGVQTVTIKNDILFPADLLQVSSFTLAPNWVGLSQPGYDLVAPGELIKTAGYPGGFSDTRLFGTITFRALKAGQAAVTFAGDNSLVLNIQNSKSPLTTPGLTNVTISPAVAVAQNNPQPQGVAALTGGGTTGVTIEGVPTEESPVTPSSEDQTAAAANALSGDAPRWPWVALAAVVVLGLGYWIYRRATRDVSTLTK
jgi:hypothetical protein